MGSLPRCMFGRSDFRTKLDTATDDTAVLSRELEIFEIRPRVGLPSMCCERASVLRFWIVWGVVAEVVILIWILRDGKVVFCWREIDGCPYAPLSESGEKQGSGWVESYTPLIQRPTNRAPRSSLPKSGSKPGIGFRFKNVWNSGTSWNSQRKARKLPSSAQGGRVTVSPSRPRRVIP